MFRPDLDDPASATEVHLYRSCSIAPLPTLKRRLRIVASLLRSAARNGFTLARGLDLNNQWSCIVDNGPVEVLDWGHLVGGPTAGLDDFCVRVGASIDRITDFVRQVVVHRRDFAISDPLVHPYRWLRPDLVPPAPFLNRDPKDTVNGSGVLVEPHAIDEHFRKAWMPFLCRGARESADLDTFRAVAGDLTPLLDEVSFLPLSGDMLYDAVHLDAFRVVPEKLTPLLGEVQLPPPLSGDMLYEVVQKKKPTAGSLDGWGWREFKALPVAWFDRLASILTLEEEDGVWPDGMLDAYNATIPKTDGDSTLWVNGYYVSYRLLIGFGLQLGYSIFRDGLSPGCPGRCSVQGGS